MMNRKGALFFFFAQLLVACQPTTTEEPVPPPTKETTHKVVELIQHVNPFIGTHKMGHTFPGATAPFGMVQLSPETNSQPVYDKEGNYNPDTYKYCSGYQYGDNTIFGFSHTHFSGTGHSDLGDFLIMPIHGRVQLNPGKADARYSGYHSPLV